MQAEHTRYLWLSLRGSVEKGNSLRGSVEEGKIFFLIYLPDLLPDLSP
jgi:hypothetical protein